MKTSSRSLTYTILVFARNAILIGFVTVLLTELVLRALGFSHVVLNRPDPLIGWSGRPGAEGTYLDEGRAEVRISSAGVRDRERTVVKPTDVWRVVLLGDSFTEALQVAEDERFTSVTERLLARCDAGSGRRVEVLNFGGAGFSTAQEYLLLKERVLRYSPDLVVLAFFPGNDIAENVRALDPAARSRPHAALNDEGQIVWDRTFEDTRSFRIKSSIVYRALLRASDFSRVVQAVFFAHDGWRYKSIVDKRREITGEQGLSDAVYSPPRTLEWEQAWRVAETLIEEVNALTAQSTARFLLVTLSSGLQVHPDAKRPAAEARRRGLTDLFYADDRLHAFAVQRGIEVLSLARPLAEYAQRKNVFLHGFPSETGRWSVKLNTLGSGHWNEEGHEAAGELITRYLCRVDTLVES